jgi:uncharacterized membrane protein
MEESGERTIEAAMTLPENRRKILHRLFDIGVVVKGIDGLLEIISGCVLMLITTPQLRRAAVLLTRHELSEDPHDAIAHALRDLVAGLTSDAKLFGSIYLLVHGFVKVFLVVGLLRGKLWSYPAALTVLSLFIAYQCYRISGQYSTLLLFLIIMDTVIVCLIWYEYFSVRRRTA